MQRRNRRSAGGRRPAWLAFLFGGLVGVCLMGGCAPRAASVGPAASAETGSADAGPAAALAAEQFLAALRDNDYEAAVRQLSNAARLVRAGDPAPLLEAKLALTLWANWRLFAELDDAAAAPEAVLRRVEPAALDDLFDLEGPPRAGRAGFEFVVSEPRAGESSVVVPFAVHGPGQPPVPAELTLILEQGAWRVESLRARLREDRPEMELNFTDGRHVLRGPTG